jgi:hypothetical protein
MGEILVPRFPVMSLQREPQPEAPPDVRARCRGWPEQNRETHGVGSTRKAEAAVLHQVQPPQRDAWAERPGSPRMPSFTSAIITCSVTSTIFCHATKFGCVRGNERAVLVKKHSSRK